MPIKCAPAEFALQLSKENNKTLSEFANGLEILFDRIIKNKKKKIVNAFRKCTIPIRLLPCVKQELTKCINICFTIA